MRRLVFAAPLLIAGACNWPPFEGPADGGAADGPVDPIVGCGREWTDITPKLAEPLMPLHGVFATASAVYAVGDVGTVLVLASGAPPAVCTLKDQNMMQDGSVLYAAYASDSSLHIAGEKGIYQASLAALSSCVADLYATSKPCYDLWISGDSGFAACDGQVQMKRPLSSTWGTLRSFAESQYFVVGSADLLISGGALGKYYVADLPAATWRMPDPSAAGTLFLRDGWFNGTDLCVVGDSRYYSCFDSATKKIPDPVGISLKPYPTTDASFLSLWSNGTSTYIAGSEKNLKVASFSTGTVWRNTSTTEPILTKDDYIFHGVHGYGKNVYVVGRRLVDAAYTGVIFCQAVGS